MNVVVSVSHLTVESAQKVVIDDLNWTVRKGENWAVIGPNGAGKTTLLRVLNGYQRITQGRISVLDDSFGETDLRDLRKKIGFVSSYLADSIPSDESVLRTVLSGRFATLRLWDEPSLKEVRRARRLLRSVGCIQYEDSPIGQLSQGEKQRTLVARALMSGPELLTLDEVSAGLDIVGREGILSSLSAIATRKFATMILVCHRIEEIPANFTHSLLLKGGVAQAQGKIHDVLTGPNLTRCFGVPLKMKRWRGRFYALVDARKASHIPSGRTRWQRFGLGV